MANRKYGSLRELLALIAPRCLAAVSGQYTSHGFVQVCIFQHIRIRIFWASVLFCFVLCGELLCCMIRCSACCAVWCCDVMCVVVPVLLCCAVLCCAAVRRDGRAVRCGCAWLAVIGIE
jgi:hypothetical protein